MFIVFVMFFEVIVVVEYKVKIVMRDSFVMRFFFGYNFGKYMEYWLSLGKNLKFKMLKIFYVNWFRFNENGKFLWLGL